MSEHPFAHLTDRQRRNLRNLEGQAKDYLKAHEEQSQKRLHDHRERVKTNLAYQDSKPLHERKMEAKEKLVAQIAREKGDRREAEQMVRRAMEIGDRKRQERG